MSYHKKPASTAQLRVDIPELGHDTNDPPSDYPVPHSSPAWPSQPPQQTGATINDKVSELHGITHESELQSRKVAKGFLTLPIRQSLGLGGCITVGGGTVLLLGAIGYFYFLWAIKAFNTSDGTNSVWLAIMLNGWATPSITLACLAVRVIVAAQSALCVSLLAALVVERCPIPRTGIAYLSVMRSVGGGPLNLLKHSFKVMVGRKEARLELFLLIVLALSSLVSQFSSTILLSDLGVTRLLQNPETVRHNVALWTTPEKGITAANMLYSQNGVNPTFGELESNDEPLAVPSNRGVSNTGLRRRAFLPFEHNNRTNLRSYDGPTVVATSRVNCLRPSISASIFLEDEYMGSKNYTHGLIRGNIFYNDTFEPLGLGSGVPPLCTHNKHLTSSACLPMNFSCSIHTFSGADIRISSDRWTTSLCSLTDPDLTTTSSNDEHNNGHSVRWNLDEQSWDPTSEWTFMTLATNMGHNDLVEMKENGVSQMQLKEPQTYQEWISFELADKFHLNMTICSVGFNATLANVGLSSSVDPREPTAKSSLGANVSVFEDIQNFLGAGASYRSQNERGVLSMDKVQDITSVESLFPWQGASTGPGNNTDLGYLFHINSIAQWVGVSFTIGTWSGQDYSILSCVDCTGVGPVVAEDSASVFQSIINTSGRVAIAIDTFIIHFAFNWYYQLLPAFDGVGDINVSFSADFIVPVHRSGFFAVAAIILAHLVCVWTITSLYAKRIKYTRQGSMWHTISQLRSEDTEALLEVGNELRDRDISKIVDQDDCLVMISRSQSGRVEVGRFQEQEIP